MQILWLKVARAVIAKRYKPPFKSRSAKMKKGWSGYAMLFCGIVWLKPKFDRKCLNIILLKQGLLKKSGKASKTLLLAG